MTPPIITAEEAHQPIPAVAPDGSLFPIGKLAAHQIGQLHLAVSIFIFSGNRLLVQQRAEGKYHSGGLWANSCCTHPAWNESAADCAARRLVEELGFSVPLWQTGMVDYRAQVGALIENEHVFVFEGRAPDDLDVSNFNPAEVKAVRWIDHASLVRDVAVRPAAYTPWLRIYLDRWRELGVSSRGEARHEAVNVGP